MSTIQKIGNYEIIREIGHGGMGVVYEGHDLRLDRKVAVKVIDFPTDAQISDAQKAELIERFKVEGRAIAKLNHPNIVSIFDCSAAGASARLTAEEIMPWTASTLSCNTSFR